MAFAVVAVVSFSLLAGAAWGLYFPLPERLKGFMMAFAGGALVISVTFELFEPAVNVSGLWVAAGALFAGAVAFTIADWLVDEKWGADSGGGLLAAITLDGVPENLALGVALIGASMGEIAALAASIFLSNLPEAAGGAANMKSKMAKGKVMLLWTLTAAFLAAAAIAGNQLLAGVSPHILSAIRAFAAGAVLASLATEVFPQAYKETHHEAGVATALGMIVAFTLM